MVKNLPATQETWVRSLGQEDPLVKGMASHSSILGWRIPWTEEPGRLQSVGSHRVGRDWATNTKTMEIIVEVPQKMKNQLAYDPVTPLLGLYTKEIKTGCQRAICTLMFMSALIVIAKIRKPKCQQINALNIYIYMYVCVCVCVKWNIFSMRKKESCHVFPTWPCMDGSWLHHAKLNKSGYKR